MRLRYAVFFVLPLLLALGLQLSTAQTDTGVQVCSAFIEEAIQTVGENCGLLDRNSACYGFTTVNASFVQPQPEGFFTLPNERTAINLLSSIATTPLRTDLDQWGIALLSIQANLPETLPGQSVIFMLLGDAEVENAVEPEDTYMPGAILSVTTQTGTNLYYQPRTNADLLDFVPENTPLQADAISSDGEYVRVVFRGVPGWIATAALAGGVDLAELAVISPETRTPGQAFFLRTNIGQTECAEAPDSLIVQGPQNLKVDLNSNGADIRIGSTIVLRVIAITPDQTRALQQRFGFTEEIAALLELTTLDGEAILDPDTPGEQRVPAGTRAFRCLALPRDLGLDQDDNDNRVIDACPWFGFEDLPPEAILEFAGFEGIVLNYPIELPLDDPATAVPLPQFVPPATNTPVPTATLPQPTNTPVFATNTPGSNPATATNTLPAPMSTATNTPVPPTATFTPTNTPPAVGCLPGIPNPIANVPDLICSIELANDEVNYPGQNVLNLSADTVFTFNAIYGAGNALPTITSDIVIVGNASTLTRGVTAPNMRFFSVAPSGRLQLEDANVSLGVSSSPGGAIDSSGTLVINASNFAGNHAVAPNGNGGAIRQVGGSLTIDASNFVNNAADNFGGAVYVEDAVLTIGQNSQSVGFNDNTAGDGGGAIAIAGSTSSFTIANAVIDDNQASSGNGGGILYTAATGSGLLDSVVVNNNGAVQGGGLYLTQAVQILDSSINNNSAASTVGGIYACGASTEITTSSVYENGAEILGGIYGCSTNTMTLLNSTVSRNLSVGIRHEGTLNLSFSTIAYNFGTGLSVTGPTNIRNSIVAGNTGTDCNGSLTPSGVNVSDDNSCAGLTVITTAQLALSNSLANNGGPTLTHYLEDSSIALDDIPPQECTAVGGAGVATDQRGLARPSFGGCDPGAIENQASSGPLIFAAQVAAGAATEAIAEASPEVTAEATEEATPEATAEATAEATPEATEEPTVEPTPEATAEPTAEIPPEATPENTPEVTAAPTAESTAEATTEPIAEPTEGSTVEPQPTATPEPTATASEPPPETTAEATVDLLVTAPPLDPAPTQSGSLDESTAQSNLIVARALDFTSWLKGW